MAWTRKIWKRMVWKSKSESLVINYIRKLDQCPCWIGIQQVMALQDPRLYTAHLWILPVPRPARTLPMPLIFTSFSAFSSTFGPPMRFRFPFLFILVSPPLSEHVLPRVISCVLLGKVVVPESLSWWKPLSNLFVVPKLLRSFAVRSLSSISIFLQLEWSVVSWL